MRCFLERSLVRLGLLGALAGATGCIGSGVDVEASHPASPSAPVAELPPVAAMLASDEPPAAAAAAPAADPHAHHRHGARGGGTP